MNTKQPRAVFKSGYFAVKVFVIEFGKEYMAECYNADEKPMAGMCAYFTNYADAVKGARLMLPANQS